MNGAQAKPEEISDRSYGTAVALCGVFGVAGIHHFYIGNWLHGLFDLGLVILFVLLMMSGAQLVAFFVLAGDAVHTIFVFYKLIVGEQRDGDGRYIRWQ